MCCCIRTTSPIATGTIILCDSSWDLSGNIVPVTGGTGSGGTIKKGNLFYIETGSDGTIVKGPDGGPVLAGWFALARKNNPGTDLSDTTAYILMPTII